MRTNHPGAMRWPVLLGAAAVWACADAPTGPAARESSPRLDATQFWDALATVRWNQRATVLLQGTVSDELPLGVPAPPNGRPGRAAC